MNARTFLAVIASALLLTACGADSTGLAVEAKQLPARSSGLLQRITDAALTTAYQGVRHYEAHTYVDGADHFLSYQETVADRGDGCYSIVPDEIESNRVHPVLFRGLQIERQAFTRRYRDFQIRDLDAFLQNYTVTDLGEERELAGHACVVLHVEPRNPDLDQLIELAVDPESALVLGSWETRRDGTLLSSLVYSQFRAGMPAHVDCFTNEIDEAFLAHDADVDMDYDVWTPKLVPAGYALEERSLLHDPLGGSWLKWTFTDGLQSLFFVQRGAAPDAELARAELGLPGEALGDRVLVYEEQAISVVQGRLDDAEVIAAGRVSSDDLLLMLDASRP